jgi:hypothetical protein
VALRPRTHSPLPWDDRYTEYMHRAGFLSLARLVNIGLPIMDSGALTALVDRWRPETHTFHLPCGEMTVTLQDVAMILGLPVDGHPVCGLVRPQGWRDIVGDMLGIRPPEPGPDERDNKPTGVRSGWFSENFSECPEDANEGMVQRYARAWMMVPLLNLPWDAIGTYSWGSATLAWLYRALCDACTRTGPNSNLAGCAYLLQVWMWERFPIGRPRRGVVPVILNSLITLFEFNIFNICSHLNCLNAGVAVQ